MGQKLHFITYGDSNKYYISKKHIINMAKKSNFFASTNSLSKSSLDQQFLKKYQNILSNSRGGGYWLWKPRLILNKINEINKGDIVVYADSGSSFNFHARDKFYEYINILCSSEAGTLMFENRKEFTEVKYTTKELFSYFKVNLNSSIAKTTQLMGGHLILRKNDHSEYVLNEFFKVVDYDNNLITDFYNKTKQDKQFITHRHDQSILSLLSKTSGGIGLKSQTFFRKGSQEQKNFPFLSVRHYGHKKKSIIQYHLNYKNIKNTPIFF